ncbi:MAG: TrmH family RNA methyltransferase [Acidobacteriota bacterium]
MPTKKRIKRVEDVLSHRQPDLRVVLEDITNTHNASAVIRTCDAAGILYLDIIHSRPEPFPINKSISTKAEKWLEFNHFSSTKECFLFLKKQKFKIASTHLGSDAVPYNSIDYTQPIALVFGNESEGVSTQALNLSDYLIQIPMFGMVQSLNLSVSAGIILYEACQQRIGKGWYDKPRLSEKIFKKYWNEWLGLK